MKEEIPRRDQAEQVIRIPSEVDICIKLTYEFSADGDSLVLNS